MAGWTLPRAETVREFYSFQPTLEQAIIKSMEKPKNLSLPFFAYGIFRPGQMTFFQIKDYVKETIEPREIAGSLLQRDGLPIIDQNGDGTVVGSLLRFADETAEKAYDQISSMEPGKQYRWSESSVDGTSANILVGRSPNKGSDPVEGEEVDGWSDPLFKEALVVIEETLEGQKDFDSDLKPLFRLQMAYLLLWSSIERYVSLRYHLGSEPMQKVEHIANERAFQIGLAERVTGLREVYRADRPKDKVILDPEDPKSSLKYYYQLRSNITHRGKAAIRDHKLILDSALELLHIFRGVLKAAQSDASVRRF